METTDTITLEQFITKHGLRFECRRVESRPDDLMEDAGMRHFRCRITAPKDTARIAELQAIIACEEISEANGAEPRLDESGQTAVDMATCGNCGKSWNDALISERTPAPSARCPYEYIHSEIAELNRLMRGKTRSFGIYFSQGSAHTADPTLADVLDCLASDANGYEGARASHPRLAMCKTEFESWAFEYGYDFDSRKAEKTFRAIKRQAEQLKRTLGQDAYEELLYNTERL